MPPSRRTIGRTTGRSAEPVTANPIPSPRASAVSGSDKGHPPVAPCSSARLLSLQGSGGPPHLSLTRAAGVHAGRSPALWGRSRRLRQLAFSAAAEHGRSRCSRRR
jgi:hypothetical protein